MNGRYATGLPRPKRVRSGPSANRLYGCTVTWRDRKGVDHAVSEPGPTLRSLQELIARTPIPAGGIRTISTWHSIFRDLTDVPRTYRGRRGRMSIDPYAYERSLLMKIGRLDLLCDEAYPKGRLTHEKGEVA